MATTTTNLGLTIPDAGENVSRSQINTNFQLIDNAFNGGTDISSYVSATRAGDSIESAKVFKLGKIVIFGIRLNLGASLTGGATIVNGLPVPLSSDNKIVWLSSTSHKDVTAYIHYNDGSIRTYNTSGTAPTGSFVVSGVYISAS